MEQRTESDTGLPNLETLAARQQELERRVLVLEQRVRALMARLTQDELEQFDRVEL